MDSFVSVVSNSKALMPIIEFPFPFNRGLHTATEYREQYHVYYD